jgi:hypothetical protein
MRATTTKYWTTNTCSPCKSYMTCDHRPCRPVRRPCWFASARVWRVCRICYSPTLRNACEAILRNPSDESPPILTTATQHGATLWKESRPGLLYVDRRPQHRGCDERHNEGCLRRRCPRRQRPRRREASLPNVACWTRMSASGLRSIREALC